MGPVWSVEAFGGELQGPDGTRALVEGRVWVARGEGDQVGLVPLDLAFHRQERFLLTPEAAVRLAGLLRAHAALAHRGLPWQTDEEPGGRPSKVRHANPPDGGWVQCLTPWPPPDPPVVWLIGWEHAVLDLAQAVAVADALEQAAT